MEERDNLPEQSGTTADNTAQPAAPQPEKETVTHTETAPLRNENNTAAENQQNADDNIYSTVSYLYHFHG